MKQKLRRLHRCINEGYPGGPTLRRFGKGIEEILRFFNYGWQERFAQTIYLRKKKPKMCLILNQLSFIYFSFRV